MKRGRFCFTAAAVCLMVFGLSISAQAKTTYRLEITNQYDTDGTSRDDNDKDRVHPLEPDVEVSEGSSDGMELASDVEWSKAPLNWSAGNEVTGTLYLGCTGSLGRDSLELRVTNGRNEAKVSSVKKYTGEDYESDLGNVYEVKFKYRLRRSWERLPGPAGTVQTPVLPDGMPLSTPTPTGLFSMMTRGLW